MKSRVATRFFIASPWIYHGARMALALMFVMAGVFKLIDPKDFARVLSHYDAIPEPLLPLIAIGLPMLELVAGVGLMFDVKGSLAVISGLLAAFVLALGYGIVTDTQVDCGCFGSIEPDFMRGLKGAFYRDIFLVMVSSYLYAVRWRRMKKEAGGNHAVENIHEKEK